MTTDLQLLYARRDLLAMRIKLCKDPYLKENLLTDYLKIQTQIHLVKRNLTATNTTLENPQA